MEQKTIEAFEVELDLGCFFCGNWIGAKYLLADDGRQFCSKKCIQEYFRPNEKAPLSSVFVKIDPAQPLQSIKQVKRF